MENFILNAVFLPSYLSKVLVKGITCKGMSWRNEGYTFTNTYSESRQRTKMQHLAKIAYGVWPLTISAKRSTVDV